MKINRAVLENALSKVKPGLEKGKEYIEQMKHVLFDGSDIATYNDHIAVLLPFETDFKTSVRFEDLFKAVGTTFAGVEEIDFSVNDKNQLILKSGKTKVGLKTTEEDELGGRLEDIKAQLPTEENGLYWTAIPDDFIQAVSLCVFSASNNMMLGPLTCIHIENDGVISSDNYRISWFKFENEIEEDKIDVLIQASDAKELVNFPVTDMCISDAWCHFITDEDIIFSTRIVEGEFMDVKTPFSQTRGGVEITFPDSLKEKIDGMLFLTEGDTQLDKYIDIDFTKDLLTCKAKNDRGWVENTVELEYSGEDKFLSINPIFLSQILSQTTTAIVGEVKSVLKAGNFHHILMHKNTMG